MAETNTGLNRPSGWRAKNRHNYTTPKSLQHGRPELDAAIYLRISPYRNTIPERGIPNRGRARYQSNATAKNKGKSRARFLERSAHSGFKNAHRLGGESQIQLGAGWVGDPILIPSAGLLTDIRPEGVNIAFRCGVEQAGKLRACDGLKHNWVNLSFSL